MQCTSWQDICDHGVAYVRDACDRQPSEDDRLHLATFRRCGLDGDWPGGGHGHLVLGLYRCGTPTGDIVLYLDAIASCCRAIGQELADTGWLIGDKERQALATISVKKTLYHEQFHHLSDMFRRLTGSTRSNHHKEEALAVSWSYLHLLAAMVDTGFERFGADFVQAAMDSWYSGYTAPGYRDWERYVHCHVFLEETSDHLMAPRSGVDRDSLIARMPDIQAGTNLFVRILMNSGRRGEEIFFPSGPGLASDRAWVVEQSVGFVGSGLHLCCTMSDLSPDMHRTYRDKKFEYVCVKESPMIRHVLELFDVEGAKHVYGDGKWVDVINKYLPENDIIGAQDELFDAGLDEFAEVE